MENRPPPPTLTSCLHPFPQLSTQRLACSCFQDLQRCSFCWIPFPLVTHMLSCNARGVPVAKPLPRGSLLQRGVSAGGPFLDS